MSRPEKARQGICLLRAQAQGPLASSAACLPPSRALCCSPGSLGASSLLLFAAAAPVGGQKGRWRRKTRAALATHLGGHLRRLADRDVTTCTGEGKAALVPALPYPSLVWRRNPLPMAETLLRRLGLPVLQRGQKHQSIVLGAPEAIQGVARQGGPLSLDSSPRAPFFWVLVFRGRTCDSIRLRDF